MKIEAGKFYRTRDGRKAFVIEDDGSHHPLHVDHGHIGKVWHYREGKANISKPSLDLIAEWTDAPDLTTITSPFGLLDRETQEALMAHGGPYERWIGDIWAKMTPTFKWQGENTYRVKPAPPKPREWWVSGGNCIWDTYAEAYNACDRGEKPIHVREVLPE